MTANFIQRIKEEYAYLTTRHWTLEDVGKFWDSVLEYDTINSHIYPYYRRFTNSYEMAKKYLPRNDYTLLDIQTRSGNGTLFWYGHHKIKKAYCVDFSDYLLSLADKKLKGSGLNYELIKINHFPLPFEDSTFDFICTYETIEHISAYQTFMKELSRVLKKEGIMILTCPNRSWEAVHSLSAILNINHSEGPHRFLKRQELLDCFKKNHLKILEENNTILLPFNHSYSVRFNNLLESSLAELLKRTLSLRRSFVLTK